MCSCGSPAAGISLLLSEALFMQISGVSLALTWPHRLCLFRVHLCVSFPLSKHTEGGDTALAFSGLRVYLQFMWEVGLRPSSVEFSSLRHAHKLSRFWLLDVRPCSCPLWPGPACLFTVLWGILLPPFLALRVPPPSLQHVFTVLIAYYSVSLFFLGGSVGLSRELCLSGPGLSAGVPHTA
jgi:hypothetical protein